MDGLLDQEALEKRQRLLCQLLVDYVSAGHFEVYRNLLEAQGARVPPETLGDVDALGRTVNQLLHVAEVVRPRLVEDGMFLVGLDIAGGKLMEINVFSPGGFGSAQKLLKVNFTEAVLNAIEQKVDYMRHYRRNFNNIDMATL